MQSIGERLEEARKRKGVSLREAAEATKIRGDYLQKLESNKFDIGLTALYVRGFLRNYAQYLKVPVAPLLGDFDALGLGEPHHARPINREVYGKVDFGSSPEPRAESPTAGAHDQNAKKSASVRTGSFGSRPPVNTSNVRPAGNSSNHALLTRFAVMIGGGVLLFGLLIWGLVSIFSGGKSPSAAPASPALASAISPVTPPAATSQAVITALDAVHIQVWVKNSNGTYGQQLLTDTALLKGEKRTVPKSGPLYLQASAMEKIQIDAGDQHVVPSVYGYKGNQTIELR